MPKMSKNCGGNIFLLDNIWCLLDKIRANWNQVIEVIIPMQPQ